MKINDLAQYFFAAGWFFYGVGATHSGSYALATAFLGVGLNALAIAFRA